MQFFFLSPVGGSGCALTEPRHVVQQWAEPSDRMHSREAAPPRFPSAEASYDIGVLLFMAWRYEAAGFAF